MASFMERVVGAAWLDAETYEEVEADEGALGQAMTVVLVSGLAAGIGASGTGETALVLGTIGALVGWFLWAALIYLVGTRLLPEPQTEADVGQLLRTIGFAAAPGVLRVLGLIPILGPLVFLAAAAWQLAAMVVAVRQALDYTSTGRAVGVCLVGFLVYVLVIGAVMLLGAAAVAG